MWKAFTSLAFMVLVAFTGITHAQTIKGLIIELNTNKPLAGVSIENLHTDTRLLSDDSGRFSVSVLKDQLVTFHLDGYKTEKLRVPDGVMPPFIKVYLEKIPAPQQYLAGQNWQRDSMMYRELYKRELEFPRFSVLDAIQHPFSALSKRNREIWAFQQEYAFFEEQKFIDYTFNAALITNITGLSNPDSLQTYLKWYRPSPQQLRNMKDYEFLEYIKRTVNAFRNGQNPRRSVIRQGGQ